MPYCVRMLLALAGGVLAGALVTPAMADPVADFYEGRTVTIVTATGAGSAYGIHGQLLADALQKYLPGHPTVVMQYMPGAGGAKMANYLYNVAPKDGSTIGFPLKYIAVNQTLARKGLKYDAAKFGYIGSLGPINSVVAILKEKAPATTIQGVMNTEVIMGSTGKSSETFITPTLMNNLLGARFKMVLGYKGMKGIDLAIERGEVHGRAGSWDSLKSGNADWLKNDRVALIALSGRERNWDLPKVPTLIELAKSPEDKAILRFFANGNAVGWMFITPPGVPAERLAALRVAFEKSVKDPGYAAAVKDHKLDLRPISAKAVETLIEETLDVPPARLAGIREAMGME